MVTCFFGVPGVGKTTLGTYFSVKELVKMARSKSKYKHVYTNFYCEGAEFIEFNVLKTHKIYDSLLIFDELSMDADNRKFKQFSDKVRDFFILHRHLGNDIIYLTQNYDMVDAKVRALTQDLWYMSKSVVPLLSQFTVARRIYRTININEHTSELVLGYRFCNFIESLFVRNVRIVWRKPYYKYFDSFEECQLEDRPVYTSYIWGHKQTFALPKEEERITESDLLKAESLDEYDSLLEIKNLFDDIFDNSDDTR